MIFPRLRGVGSACGPMIAADHLAKLLKKPLDDVCRKGEILAEGLLKAHSLYQPDFIIVFADVSVEAEAMGVKLEYFFDRNPQPVNHLNFGGVRPLDISIRGRLPELFTAAEICRENLGGEFTIFFSMKDPLSLAAMTTGTEEFLSLLVLDPQRAFDILETCCASHLHLLDRIIEGGFIPFIGAPIASGSLIGERNFRRFALPYLSRLFSRLEELDAPKCLHICGSVADLLEPLSSCPPDLLSLEDAAAVKKWDLLPDTVPMGYTATDLFVKSSANTVENAAADCMAAMPAPYVLSTGCDLPASAKPELVKAMKEAYEKYKPFAGCRPL